MANTTMGSGTSTATNQKSSAAGSTATTKPTASGISGKETTSTPTVTVAASTASAAAAAASTPTAAAPAINAASLKKLPRETFNKQTPAPPNSFQAYLEKLDAEKQISYLMLGASEVLPNFNVKRTHPYSFFFFKKKGYKQIFQPNKNIIVQEIKRRHPEAKPNQNNRSNDELMEMLRERWPLLEPDKRYVLQKEKDYRKVLLSALNPKDVINLDEMSELVPSPHAQGLGVPMSTNARKRLIGETGVSSPSRNGMSTLGSVAAATSHSYYATSNKRRASTSSLNGSSSSGAVETMLIQAANECAGKLAYANLAKTIESLKKERFDLQMQKLPLINKHTPANVQTISMIDNRIQEISDSILTYEAKMSNGVVKV